MVGIVGYCWGLESNSHPGFNGESSTTMTLAPCCSETCQKHKQRGNLPEKPSKQGRYVIRDSVDDDADDGGAFSTRLSAIAN